MIGGHQTDTGADYAVPIMVRVAGKGDVVAIL